MWSGGRWKELEPKPVGPGQAETARVRGGRVRGEAAGLLWAPEEEAVAIGTGWQMEAFTDSRRGRGLPAGFILQFGRCGKKNTHDLAFHSHPLGPERCCPVHGPQTHDAR